MNASNALTVLHPGMSLELQQLPRPGWRAQGIPAGGAMDAVSFQTANLLCGNSRGAAALELTLGGAQLRVDAPGGILAAMCGADMAADVDGWPLQSWRTVYLPPGSTLTARRARSGCRAYLAVGGGFCGVAGASQPHRGADGTPGGAGARAAAPRPS
ncbi:biotin-dependent carboxyltransferase family protein, partial [Paenibacillus pasadenensis]|nr:biotin-dependent carboxyltransferase family protein [Paenibacillus pasadenensis]